MHDDKPGFAIIAAMACVRGPGGGVKGAAECVPVGGGAADDVAAGALTLGALFVMCKA